MSKIIDMNFDCIEHVLKFLDFKDLLNAAQSNQTLNLAACTIISRRYSKQNLKLVIDLIEMNINLSSDEFKMRAGVIYPLNFETALKILRHFGRICPKININYSYTTLQQRKQLEFYLGEYCADCDTSSFTEIELDNCPEDALNWIYTPLKSVQKVTITGHTNWNFKQLQTKVPNMNNLHLYWLQVRNPTCIEQNFPALKHFEVDVRDRTDFFTEDNVKCAVIMNPQLESVNVNLFSHPGLKEEYLVDFFRKNFEANGKVARVVCL